MMPDSALTDTGPIFALVDPKGQLEQFTRCRAVILTIAVPLVTTWPCFAEAMYLTGKRGNWPMQKLIANLVSGGTLRLHTPSSEEIIRILHLMEQYADRPMDLADASLIALAETAGYTRIFSLDSDFYVYRLADGTALEVVPGLQGGPRG